LGAPRQYEEDAPTQVDNVGSATGPTDGGASSRGSASSLVTARETLGFQEIQRTRTFMRIAIALAVAQAWALPFVGGDRTAKAVLAFAVVLVVAVCGRLLLLLRDEEGYSTTRAVGAAYATIFAVFAGIHFYGVFSPGAAVVPLGIYFFCTGQSDRASVAVYATCAAAYGLLGALVVSGIMPDHGIITADRVPLLERIVILVLIEGIFYAV